MGVKVERQRAPAFPRGLCSEGDPVSEEKPVTQIPRTVPTASLQPPPPAAMATIATHTHTKRKRKKSPLKFDRRAGKTQERPDAIEEEKKKTHFAKVKCACVWFPHKP